MRFKVGQTVRAPLALLSLAVVALLLLFPAGTLYYEYSGGQSCARCHEISETFHVWQASTHRSVKCSECHGGILTPDASFHAGNLRRVVHHLQDQIPETIHIRQTEVALILNNCRRCHEQEFADWQSGPHSSTYKRIFLDNTHNHKELLMDDCLRCHGMHFEGSIRQLVTPVNTAGPWHFTDAALENAPAIPCLTCHQIHRQGQPMGKRTVYEHRPGTGQEITRPSLAVLDRRELKHVTLANLPLPEMLDGERTVKISPDRRQALCYQCHAPVASRQVNSADDRTPVGVHEGISCLACHQKHGQQTRASCVNCHPRLSNCGLNVETMDTTFFNTKSPHNVHFVKCADCHPKGVPPRKKMANTGEPVHALQNRVAGGS